MKYYGKEKCRILKQIRAEIARQNGIEWVVEECAHKGNCKGTCPRCEAEVRQLEKALARREAMGRTVAVVGISAGLALSVSGCADLSSSTTLGMMVAPDISADSQTEVLEGESVIDDTAVEATETEYEIPLPMPGEVPEQESVTDIVTEEKMPDQIETGLGNETDETEQPTDETIGGGE